MTLAEITQHDLITILVVLGIIAVLIYIVARFR